jgi:hypothetical protein
MHGQQQKKNRKKTSKLAFARRNRRFLHHKPILGALSPEYWGIKIRGRTKQLENIA